MYCTHCNSFDVTFLPRHERELQARNYLAEMLTQIYVAWRIGNISDDGRLEHCLANAVDFQRSELPNLLSN